VSAPFDKKASGYVRSETVCALFIQKKLDAKRIYAEIIHTKVNNDGYKPEGTSYPSTQRQKQLMEEFYSEIDVGTDQVQFVEAHSAGTQVGDFQEVSAIDEVFNKVKTRQNLKIGSVKSSMGHSEAASCTSAIAKVLLSFENSKLPPNINLNDLRQDVAAFRENRIDVVTKPTDFSGDYVAVNSFGLGGANCHILLKRNVKDKRVVEDSCDLPRLVVWSGRTETAVQEVFADISKRRFDREFIALLHSSQSCTSELNNIRGYGIFMIESSRKTWNVKNEISNFDGVRRPVVWVFSGMGSQWPGMLSDLMRIPVFCESIKRSHKVLEVENFDLMSILTKDDASTFESVVKSYVGIIAIEIAIVDVLRSLEIVPDFIIGHSLGEISCAYADECLSAEEAILIAYLRGVAGLEGNSIKGSMAAVGLHHSNLRSMLPEDIDIACHNGISSTTISGPYESVQAFVEELRGRNILTKIIRSSKIAFHSRYIVQMGERFKDSLQSKLVNPKKRSPKWLSSTFSRSTWEQHEFASIEYFVGNLLHPVLFDEVCQILPKNSLMIEVGPHELLKSILKENVSGGLAFGMMQRGNREGSMFFLETLGR
jgi:fatty acid synthase, animal type